MKKIVVNNIKTRRLMAVTGCDGLGLWVRGYNGKSQYIGTNSCISEVTPHTLEEILAQDSSRVPVYECDTLTIIF